MTSSTNVINGLLSNGNTGNKPYRRSGTSIGNFRRGEGLLRTAFSNEDVRSAFHHQRKSEKIMDPDKEEISDDENNPNKKERARRTQMRSKLKKSLSMVVPREAQQLQGIGRARPVATYTVRRPPANNTEEEGRKRTISS